MFCGTQQNHMFLKDKEYNLRFAALVYIIIFNMALFEFKWLRRFVRRHTTPIEFDRAAVWKRRLSVGYAIVAWHAFGLVCYMVYTGRNDWARYYGYKTEEDAKLSSGEQYVKMLNIEKAKIIRYSGFQKVNETEIDSNTKS